MRSIRSLDLWNSSEESLLKNKAYRKIAATVTVSHIQGGSFAKNARTNVTKQMVRGLEKSDSQGFGFLFMYGSGMELSRK